MLSSSAARYPAFSNQTPDRDLETSLDPDEIQLYSHILPTIVAGKYKLEVEQTIVFPDQPPEDTGRVLSLNRRFNVQGPKFKLLDNEDNLSVHPAPGHAAPNNTLAHVVFTDPSSRILQCPGRGQWDQLQANELLRSKDELSALGDLGPQSHYGTFTALAGKVKAASQQGTITTVMDSVSYGKDYQDSDFLAFITMPEELFQDLFADYTSGQKNWSGTPDLRRYSYMAHVREVHGGFMASTTQEKAQIQYGVVTNANAKWAMLISLHAWHWKCTQPERTSFVDAVAALGRNVQPLRVPDKDLQAFSQPDDPSKSDDSPLAASKRWLVEKLKSGYILLPHTIITGEKVNDFLATPIATGPRRGSRPQVPKWGFFLRSMAVTAFPDLKIEVPLPSGSESGLSEVTYMQKLSDDIIICLLDRCPGESTLKSIKITQPGHQQGFSLGNKLTANNIDLQFRFLPNQPGVKLEDIKGDTAVSRSLMDHTVPPIYHWPSHTLLSQEFARQSVLALRKPNIFEWAGDDSNPDPGGVPCSIVASQLSTAILKLDFNVPSSDSSPLLEPSLDYSNTTWATAGPSHCGDVADD
ncbi:hypothetical protein NW756_013355 [Fusarium oxysporum]|nr:hypothetical protein NW756_013355 [Fusarium oxysporum]